MYWKEAKFSRYPETTTKNHNIERVMNMEKKKQNRARKRTRKKRNVVGIVLMVMLILLTLLLIGILIFVAVNLSGHPNEVVDPETQPKAWSPVETTDLSEDIFFANHTRATLGDPKIAGDVSQMQQIGRWNHMTEAVVNYHMTIVEEETYGATAYIGERCLGKTQTRQIDVYSTSDKEHGQWYLLEVQEKDCFHASQYSIAPGMYFWKADGSSPIYTILGEITGTQKDHLMELLSNYLLTTYVSYVEARMGELQVQAYSAGSGITAMTLKNDTGMAMLTGNVEEIGSMTANYAENEGDTVYNFVMEVAYGETYDIGVVNLERKNPYNWKDHPNEISFWNGEKTQAATLENVEKANETWHQLHIPEQFSARVTVNTSAVVMAHSQKQVDNYYIVCSQQQILNEKAYHRISIEYIKRGLADSEIQAGTYIFDDEFIWTDIGVLRIENAPRLYEILKSFGTETYLNANWQMGMCGDMYLEMYENKDNHRIHLIERGDQISGHPNYAKVIANNQYQIEELQTHTSYRAEDKWDVSTSLEATISYKPEKVAFSLPSVIEN